MLNRESLLKKMILHFPKWMDIRKRYKTSKGGQLLNSIAKETETIQEAINDYQKDFFIESYFGVEESIPSLVLKAHIGALIPTKIKLINIPTSCSLTQDLKTFYTKKDVYYFENGYFFFKIDSIDKKEGENLIYEYENNRYSTPLIYHQIWNIFDEFALYVGLTRLDKETNLELEKRILTAFKKKTNGTEAGLKHAIYTELLNIDPDLKDEEIKIEGITQDNAHESYEDKDVLTASAELNKDCYMYKRWDVDPWNYDIKSIDYLPHSWDVALTAVTDGVGKKDDLKITTGTVEEGTKANISIYQKNIETLNTYLKNNPSTINQDIEYIKYSDELKPVTAEYKVIASPVLDITNENIKFTCNNYEYINKEIPISNLIESYSNVKLRNEINYLEPGNYSLKVYPKKEIMDYSISDLHVKYADSEETINLMITQNGYMMKDGKLCFEDQYCFLKQTYDYDDYSYKLENTENGIKIKDDYDQGSLAIKIPDILNKSIYSKYILPYSPIPKYKINNLGYKEDTNGYYSYTKGDVLEISTSASSIKFDIEGSVSIKIYKMGNFLKEEKIENQAFLFEEDTNGKANYNYKIIITNNSVSSILNLEYHDFIISELILNNGDLTIDMATRTDKSPILEGVYVSKNLNIEQKSYFADFELTKKGYLVADVSDDYVITIYKKTGEKWEQIVFDYKTPQLEYLPVNNKATIYLDLKDYAIINNIICEENTIETYLSNEGLKYKIIIDKSSKVSTLKLEAIKYKTSYKLDLVEKFNIHSDKGDKLYVSNGLIKGFIAVRNNIQEIVYLKDIIDISYLYNGIFDYEINNPEINKIYINKSNNQEIFTNTKFEGTITDSYLTFKSTDEYVSYDKQILFQNKKEGILINENFNPSIEKNELLCYIIENNNLDFDIKFYTDDSSNTRNFSLGKSNIVITTNYDYLNKENYYYKTLKISLTIPLIKNNILEDVLKDNNITDDLTEYVIKNNQYYSILYDTVDEQFGDTSVLNKFYQTEIIQKEQDGFNKLKKCNIDKIIKIGVNDPNSTDFYQIPDSDYTLLKEEGIIVWNNESAKKYDYENIYILYSIKIPTVLVLNNDFLYEKISTDLNGYDLVLEIKDLEINPDNLILDFSNYKKYFNNNYKIIIICENPIYNAKIENTNIIFYPTYEEKTLFIKPGYYYINNEEYYYLSQGNKSKSSANSKINYSNVKKYDDKLILTKTSRNFISNSAFETSGLEEIYNKNFEYNNRLFGISSANKLTACNSYNFWYTVNASISLVQGLNDLGLKINTQEDGLVYIEITNFLFDKSFISIYLTNNLKLYIGEENKIDTYHVPNTNSFKIIQEFEIDKNDIYTTILDKKENTRYYLIAKGEGILDDIIIINHETYNENYNYHLKNINRFKLNIEETIDKNSILRFYFDKNSHYKKNGAELDENNRIITSSNISWGYTKIKEYTTFGEWNNCEQNYLKNKNDCLFTENVSGYLFTDPIFIGDMDIIKSIVIKINDLTDNDNKMSYTLFASNEYDGVYTSRATSIKKLDNFLNKEFNSTDKYIRIKINMMPYTMLQNLVIFIEYKETANKAPIENIYSNGQLISEIYDTHNEKKFKLVDIKLQSISNINNIKIQIRASKVNELEHIWTDWKTIQFKSDGTFIDSDLIFEQYRFFQFKFIINKKEDYVQFNSFDLKVVE